MGERRKYLTNLPDRNAELDNLPAYFIDRTELLDRLRHSVRTPHLEARRIVNICGSVGSGKSAVLRMVEIFCKQSHIPVAAVSANPKFTEIEVMKQFAGGLENTGTKLKSFYSILAELDKLPSDERPGAAAGAQAIDAVAQIPSKFTPLLKILSLGIGYVGKIFSSRRQAKREHLRHNELSEVTNAFLEDVAKHSKSVPIVLILDNQDQIDDLDIWLCDWLHFLSPNVLVVIAGQGFLGSNSWNDKWPDWAAHIKVEPLETLPSDERRQLVIAYYKMMLGAEPEPRVVQEILAGGDTPLSLVTEVQLRKWGYHGPGRPSGSERPEAIAESLLRNTSKELRPVMEAAATLRFFDHEVLANVAGAEEATKHFDALGSSKLVTRNDDGLTFQNSVREIIDSYLKRNYPDRHQALHERARDFCRRRVAQFGKEQRERQKWELERLYHEFQLSESHAMEEFRAVFETALRQKHELDFCRSLINDATAHIDTATSRARLSWYRALVTFQLGKMEEAFGILEELNQQNIDPELQTSLLEWFANIHWLQDHTAEAQQFYEQYFKVCEFQRDLAGQVRVLISLGNLNKRTGRAEEYFIRAAEVHEKIGDNDDQVIAQLDKELADWYRLQGRFREAEERIRKSTETYQKLDMKFEQAHAIRTHAMLLSYTGKLREAEDRFHYCIKLFDECAGGSRRSFEKVWPWIGLGDVALGKRKFQEALQYYRDAEASANYEFVNAVVAGCFADLYCAQKQWDKSLEYADRSLVLRGKHWDKFGVGWMLNTKGNCLLGKGSLMSAMDCFDRGIRIGAECGSLLLQCKLALGKCEVHYRKNELALFKRTSEEVHTWGQQHGFWDLLARLHILEGLFELQEPAPSVKARHARLERVGQHFSEGLKCALQYNGFLLYETWRDLREELSKVLVVRDQTPLFTIFKSYWVTEKINGVNLLTIENRERGEYDLDAEPSLIEQLTEVLG